MKYRGKPTYVTIQIQSPFPVITWAVSFPSDIQMDLRSQGERVSLENQGPRSKFLFWVKNLWESSSSEIYIQEHTVAYAMALCATPDLT